MRILCLICLFILCVVITCCCRTINGGTAIGYRMPMGMDMNDRRMMRDSGQLSNIMRDTVLSELYDTFDFNRADSTYYANGGGNPELEWLEPPNSSSVASRFPNINVK